MKFKEVEKQLKNKSMKKLMMAALLVIGGSLTQLNAQKTVVVTNDETGWQKIGETKVDFSKDRDEVTILGADKFAKLKLKVTDAPVEFFEMEVFYENGRNQVVPIKTLIKKSGESKVIDLDGGERNIKSIVLKYKTIANYKDVNARVEIWGKKTNAK